ncbi:MAG TPA: magnesium transporter [Ktedonobacteraceae bacterium]|nr:magnesium transporter [Ktedonobacteraceae bacterium]
MIFLSALLRRSVYDNEHRRIGTLKDVCVELSEIFPVVTALVVQPSLNANSLFIPWSQVQSIEEPQIHLTVSQSQIAPYEPHADELLLKRDILDTQIVDTQGFRVVKVNDLKLAQIKKTARLVGVDIGMSGLLRRLGWQSVIEAFGRVTPLRVPERIITWNYVEPVRTVRVTGQLAPALAGTAGGGVGVVPQVQLNVSHTKLADLHPADIADILEQLDIEEAGAMLERLDKETAADALSEIEHPLQSELLNELDPEHASDLLEQLAPDDAADILAEIPRTQAEQLLNLMPAEESQPIRELLRYGAETAGGIMTTEVLALPQDATVEDALAYLRQHSAHLEMIYYLYIIDEDRHLMGVVSLRQLVTAEPTTRLGDLMDTDVITVRSDADQEEVARIIAKYDLLGAPVVDAENHLVGLVTVDDVIDVIHEEQAEDFSEIAGADVEEAEEKEGFSFRNAMQRSAWLWVNVLAGFILALIVSQVFGSVLSTNTALVQLVGIVPGLRSHLALNSMICFMPMLLLTSGSAGAQSLGIMGWRLRTRHGRDLWQGIFHELQLGTVGGVLTSVLVGVLVWLLFRSGPLSLAIALAFGVTLLVASIGGLMLPHLLQGLRLRGSLITAPLLDPVIATVSLSVFFAVTLVLVGRLGV